jgi:ABC-2 type transport system ATP-binding protein
MTDQPAVEAAGLRKCFRGTAVLNGVDLAVPAGSVFALLGRNGAGKTTTVRILATLLRPDGGRAAVAGHDVVRQRRQVRRAISLTGQYPAVDELQTGAENLRMMGQLSGLTAQQARGRAGELLEAFTLAPAADRRVATYSGGMRRRLDIAASLVTRPAVIFLDEPTTGLDLPSRQSLWQVITGLTYHGVTVFLTTQYLEEADQMADRIAVIHGGIIAAEGTAADLKQRVAGHRLELAAADTAAYAALLTALGGRALSQVPERLTLSASSDSDAASVRGLLDRIDPGRTLISSFTLRAASMDDVFLALTSHGDRQVPTPDRQHATRA